MVYQVYRMDKTDMPDAEYLAFDNVASKEKALNLASGLAQSTGRSYGVFIPEGEIAFIHKTGEIIEHAEPLN